MALAGCAAGPCGLHCPVTVSQRQLLRDCSASLDLAVIYQCVTVTCTLSTQAGWRLLSSTAAARALKLRP
jgi:hypothetical protein